MSRLDKFIFDGMPVRGSLVRLDGAWQELLRRRAGNADTGPYPQALVQMLGQMSAASILLQASISFDGTLLLQVAGDGPVRMAVCEVDARLRFRATASWSSQLPGAVSLDELINVGGQGHCAITLDSHDKSAGRKAWQGVVPLQDDDGRPLRTVPDMLQAYMQQSEQLDTVLVLAASSDCAAGLMLQRLPGAATDKQGDDFQRLAVLARSLRDEELLTLDADAVLHRLYWNEPLQRLALLRPDFRCSCSRERVATMLKGLGEVEVVSVLEERGEVEVGCQFCGAQYRFDRVDVAALFNATQAAADPASMQ